MSDQSQQNESSQQLRLDKLIADFLQAEEKEGTVDPQQFIAREPDLAQQFQAFVAQHLEMKRRRGESNIATLPFFAASPKAPRLPKEPLMYRTVEQGSVLGDCCVLRELGRGGMGVVYLGRHLRLDALRAIKVLPRENILDNAVARFWREAQTAARISHLNVVTIHDVGHQDDLHYITMQFVDGETLTQIQQRHALDNEANQFPWQTALRLAHPVIDALAAMHAQGLIHRDIKPSNIMVSDKGSVTRKQHVWLMDFGLVRDRHESQLSETSGIVGTPAYMAPEQARGETVDGRADIYAVGASIYFLLTGRHLFEGRRAEVFYKAASGQRPKPLTDFRPDLPPAVHELVERAISPNVGDRFNRAEAMLKNISEVLRAAPKETRVKAGTTANAPSTPASTPPKGNKDSTGSSQAATQALHDTVSECGDTSRDHPPVYVPLEAVEIRARGTRLPHPRFLWDQHVPQSWTFAPVRNWVIGFSAFAVIAAFSTAFFVFSKTPKNVAQFKPIPEKKPVVAPSPDTRGMVLVPAGSVHIGASEQRLRRHAQSLSTLQNNPEQLESFISFCQNEPEQTVHVAGFWIDQYEVTNDQYARFIKVTGYAAPSHWVDGIQPTGTGDHPVTNLRYRDAAAFAAWANKKLPTIAQWVRAFRGSDDRMYPWGDTWSPDRANVKQNAASPVGTSPVDKTPSDVSPFGVFNMVGNVCEIMRDRSMFNGQNVTISKGAHSQALGDIYGAAPCQFLLIGEDLTFELIGFRCVIEQP